MKFNFDYEPQDLYKLFDYEIVDVLLKVKFWSGIYVIQTKVDMFYVDEEVLTLMYMN